jgi:hypothetical protein
MNVIQGSYSFGDYQQIVYEEQTLKSELGQHFKIPFHTERLMGVNLFPNRFDQTLLKRLRLSFLTSQSIMDIGGTQKLKETVDFETDFDMFNEECSV